MMLQFLFKPWENVTQVFVLRDEKKNKERKKELRKINNGV